MSTTYIPIPEEEIRSLIGEGLHTGLRKGTDAPGANALWTAIADSDQAWSDALRFLVRGLEVMGLAVCRKEES
jgi:hypothetical protein